MINQFPEIISEKPLKDISVYLKLTAQRMWIMAQGIDRQLSRDSDLDAYTRDDAEKTIKVSSATLLDLAKASYNARRRREKLFGTDLFGEPAWDMLLDLYVSGLSGKRVSTTSLCGASGVPNTTALRWIKSLERAGLTERVTSAEDGRVAYQQLTERGRAVLTRFFSDIAASKSGVRSTDIAPHHTPAEVGL